MKIYQLGEKLQFHSQYRGNFYLGKGWSIPEKNHRWSNGHEAEIIIRFRQLANNNLILRIRCSGYLANNAIEYQQVDVVVNLVKVGTWQVNKMDWYEVNIPRNLISDNVATIKLIIGSPISPAQYNLSKDNRQLGVNIDSLVIFDYPIDDLATDKKVSIGSDFVGYVFESSGSYHRFVRKEDNALFRNLLNHGIYANLTKKQLIPDHYIRAIDNDKYSHIASSITGCFIYPPNYPLLMLRDAANVWISINEELLNFSESETYGLCDGHYGNFVQINNAKPLWCDIGSISNIQTYIEYGYGQLVRCYIIPMIVLMLPNDYKLNIRHMMHKNLNGLKLDDFISMYGSKLSSWKINENYPEGNRRHALSNLRKTLEQLDFSAQNGYWSDYRDVGALNSAWNGDLLGKAEDSRFEAVINLIKRSDATSFIDIGCNDGIFSLMCAREGMKGIAMDLDEHALNKLYSFVKERPEINLSISYGDFLNVPHVADVVMALALTHHLALSQKLTFDAIAQKLAQITNKAAVTEFMPDGLGGIHVHPAPSPDPLPSWYTLENFIFALKKHFKLVEVIDYTRSYTRKTDLKWFSRRVLIYCEWPTH